MTQDFVELDVRPMLERGEEPFNAIMTTVAALSPGQGLRLIAPFRPQPLFSVLARQGFDHEVVELEGGDFEVRFTRPQPEVTGSDSYVDAATWPEPAVALDLSDLEPPQPMVRILSKLEEMAEGEVLFAVLAREPMFLFPELSKRGHQWVGNFDKAGTAFRIMIRKGTA